MYCFSYVVCNMHLLQTHQLTLQPIHQVLMWRIQVPLSQHHQSCPPYLMVRDIFLSLKTKHNRMKIEQYGERLEFGFLGTCPSRNFALIFNFSLSCFLLFFSFSILYNFIFFSMWNCRHKHLFYKNRDRAFHWIIIS